MSCLCDQLTKEIPGWHPDCLGHLWLFKDLPGEDLAALGRDAVRRRTLKGQRLFAQGEQAREMFLLKAGRIKLTKLLPDGNEIILGFRQAGSVLGETCLTEDETYPLSAWCMEDSFSCGLTREQFETLVLAHPRIGLQVIRNMSERIDWLTHQVESVSVSGIDDRLFQALQNLARELGEPAREYRLIPFPLTHEELGFLIGAHRVSVTRALGSLKLSGRVRQSGNTLAIQMIEA